MTLHVHRAERTSELTAGLQALLSEAPADPFASEVVAVPTKGVERWLAQSLSHVLGGNGEGAGVCANVRFPSPAELLTGALTAGTGIDPEDDPWSAGHATWALLGVIEQSRDEPWCDVLTGYVDSATSPPGRRLATAQRIARLFQSYAASRPQLLLDWQAGEPTDGAGRPLPADLQWQVELWRGLREAIGEPSPAERLGPAAQRLRADPGLVDLPERISLFGPTRLSTAQLVVLDTLAHHRDVHLWLPHPSPALWQKLRAHETATLRRADDGTAASTANPLLASLGRDVRELQQRLPATATHDHLPAAGTVIHTVLTRLQQSIRDDVQPAEPIEAGPDDRSVQVHACHGAARQAEVLREVLVGLLQDDDTLEPRDVLVMCPDIEDYAPLISATFGLADDDGIDAHPGHTLRVRLADRSLRQTNSLLGLLAGLLELAAGRVTASQVLDLAALPPVMCRFGFDDDDLEALQEWVAASGVRWGLDGQHRAPYRLEAVAQNTWRTGLDRILLGAAMAEDDLRWVDRTLPLDDVDSNDISLAGRLAELLDRLTVVLDRLSGAHPLTTWLDTLRDALDLLADVPDSEDWQRAQAMRELADLVDDAGSHAGDTLLRLGDLHALLADRLVGRPTRANFRTGNLTMCSMVPMRSVPHRVICLLGLDDGAFPRGAGIDGDNVLARDPCIGERDPRSEDRQLLLDAILAAREHLVILYTGADPRTNTERPPAVPVGEILDAMDALASYDGRAARDHLVVRHPLQPFDPRNFITGRLGAPGPFSFDRLALAGARRAAQPRDLETRFLAQRLEPDPSGDLLLDDLIGFVEHPTKAFLRQRLAMSVRGEEDGDVDDELIADLDALQTWRIGERVLQDRLRGHAADVCRGAEWRRGTLPPAALGNRVLDLVMSTVEPLVQTCAPHLMLAADAYDISVTLGGRELSGTINGVRGDVILRATYARLGAKHRLRAWVQLLALTVAVPGRPWRAVSVGKGAVSTMTGVTAADARSLLGDLVELRDLGLCEPLPIAAKASAEYAARRGNWDDEQPALGDAGKKWRQWFASGGGYIGEFVEPAHVAVYGLDAAFDLLLAEPAEADTGEGTRFGELARRLWDPVRQYESQAPL